MTVAPPPKRVFDPMMPRTGHYRAISDIEDQSFVLRDQAPGFVLEHRVLARPPSPRRKT